MVTGAGSGATTPAGFVAAVLDDMERVAAELLPAWLPEAADIHRTDLGGVAAVRIIAEGRAARAHYSRPLLRDLALLALTGQRTESRLPARARAGQLARLIAESFGRERCVLLVSPAPGLTPLERDAAVAGGDWLARHARAGIWLVSDVPVDVERVPVVTVDSWADEPGPPPVVRAGGPEAVVVGRPHPASAVEAALEAALAAESWAAGRRWNQTYQPTALSAPIRLDLCWPRERCVVELDGPEHCHPVRFEADRQRDVQLQLDGYAVLRFTNARVVHDVGAVVHQIGTYIRGRRRDTAEGS
ncbi:hypothetical protein AMIS_12480 [Actinoplanes missouriensis 431]|uniref:DUF559 domain-containing protein n=1 Tax=Actinoplanes missouriensis (strain ATCC 14538 / DSM 43046 / CBS 188.64 / JCM 3121 / NBRC 102363 / NCIMB 12654 / NRRL B-3342 / UNCC 431) TaxID=512565 RepID=I0H0D1_ACTM4|nr:DUF559 domain-containing protein [Actinoplanes missouriensis]BAL86468.1 hypothetical protein AMIS_12480 [Actinoplanes missouriensis 431]